MSLPKGTDKKFRKTIKKLNCWIKKLQRYKLFEICRNAKHDLVSLLALPITAALNNRSIENQSQIEGRVSADDFYHHANNKLTVESISKMFLRYVHEIIKLLKNFFHCSRFAIAVDKTDDPYWGEIENAYVTGGKRERSTNYAFRYLTAAIVVKGFEFVLYARPLTKEDTKDALLVEECLQAIRKLGIDISRLLLDREFYNSDIIFLCNFLDIDYIIPVVKNSRFNRWLKTFKRFPRIEINWEVNDELTNLLLFEETNSKDEKEIFGFITNIEPDNIKENPDEIINFYRRRWAIENANKFQDAFNIHTNSTNGIVRYFFFVLTALLYNFWVLARLLAEVFSLCKISLNMFKDICKTLFGFAIAPKYKHAQHKLWLGILLG